MSRLTLDRLGDTLSAILGVDRRYVVPKQGNWWNPQEQLPEEERPATWCAYMIYGMRPITMAHYVTDGVTNWSVQHRIGKLSLQFVGTGAEELALDVGHWTHRSTVALAFGEYDGRIMGNTGEVTVTDFDGAGDNAVKAYNVDVNLAWADEVDTGQGLMPNLVFEGEVL